MPVDDGFANLDLDLDLDLDTSPSRQTHQQKTVAALLALLDAVLPRVPEPVLVSRFAGAARILSAAVRATVSENESEKDDTSSASAARHAVAALATALAAAAPSVVAAADWPGAPAPAFSLLLQVSLDARPKVRRAASNGIVRSLAGLRMGAALAASSSSSSLARLPASAPYPSAAEVVLALARAVLPAPAAAARAAASAPANAAAARSAADAAVRRSVVDALHCLSLLREVAGILPAASVAALPPLIAPLFELGSPVLTRAAADALSALASVEQNQQASSSSSSPPVSSSSAPLVALVRSLAASPGAWSDGRDAVSTSSVCGALSAAMRALHSADAAAAAAELPGAISALCGPLTSASSADGARGAAAAALLSVVEGSAAAACAAAAASKGKQKQKPLAVRVAAALAGALSPRSRAGWAPALPAAAAFFDAAAGEVAKAGDEGASSPASEAAALLLERVGELVAGANDAAERKENCGEDDEDQGSLDFAAPAAAALGRALRSLGPRFVLSVLPLNIIEALDESGGDPSKIEPRTWMLPLLRQHASGGSLRFWGDSVLPLARACGDRAGAAAASGDAQRAMACRALEAQAWATLPTFACWALDGGDALR